MSIEDKVVSQHLQDCFVYLAITSNEFQKLTRQVLLPGFFTSTICENLVQICYEYFDEFGKAPGDHFHDELVKRLPQVKESERSFYVEYLKRLQGIGKPDLDYVIKRASRFIQCRQYEDAAVRFATLVSEGEFDDAQKVMYNALKAGIQKENVGLKYLTDFTSVFKRLEGPQYLVGTGIQHLDRLVRGMKRAQLVCYLGGFKGKKSWALQHLATAGVESGLGVVYLTHELTQDEVEMRLDRMWGSLAVPGFDCDFVADCEVNVKVRNPRTGEITIEKMKRPSVYNVDAVLKVRKRVTRTGGKIVVKKYPMGTCKVSEVNRYLDYLERFEKFIPDIVITDYGDIMAPERDRGEIRHNIDEIYKGLKSLADERNILVATASQGNRDAIRKKRPSQKDVAEDIRKLAHVDMMVGVCQTDDMVGQEVGSMWVVVNRGGRMDCGCSFLMNLDIGQFCSCSWFDD